MIQTSPKERHDASGALDRSDRDGRVRQHHRAVTNGAVVHRQMQAAGYLAGAASLGPDRQSARRSSVLMLPNPIAEAPS